MATVRSAVDADWTWINANADGIGGPQVVSNGVLHTLANYPAGVCEHEDSPCGFVVYIPQPPECELLAIAATSQNQGIGTLMMEWVEETVAAQGCSRIWLATTNDNLDAIRFYQRRGYQLYQLRRGAFREVKQLKGLAPDEQVLGHFDIPIRDELQLEKHL